MNFLSDKYELFEGHIFPGYLKINTIYIQKELNIMLIVLNNGKVLKIKLTVSEILNSATQEDLVNYRVLGNGAGIFWPALNEDFSLDDYLQERLMDNFN